MGKGGAQLGKSLKGKTKEQVLQAAQQQAEQKKVELAEVAATTQLDDDVKQMAEYERLAKLAEAHRQRLKVCSCPCPRSSNFDIFFIFVAPLSLGCSYHYSVPFHLPFFCSSCCRFFFFFRRRRLSSFPSSSSCAAATAATTTTTTAAAVLLVSLLPPPMLNFSYAFTKCIHLSSTRRMCAEIGR